MCGFVDVVKRSSGKKMNKEIYVQDVTIAGEEVTAMDGVDLPAPSLDVSRVLYECVAECK